MNDQRRALALHLTGGRPPLFIAVPPDDVDAIVAGLPDLMRKGQVEVITAANGAAVVVNFAHVQAAHLDNVPGPIIGSTARDPMRS